jgi:hypothetical protein
MARAPIGSRAISVYSDDVSLRVFVQSSNIEKRRRQPIAGVAVY